MEDRIKLIVLLPGIETEYLNKLTKKTKGTYTKRTRKSKYSLQKHKCNEENENSYNFGNHMTKKRKETPLNLQ